MPWDDGLVPGLYHDARVSEPMSVGEKGKKKIDANGGVVHLSISVRKRSKMIPVKNVDHDLNGLGNIFFNIPHREYDHRNMRSPVTIQFMRSSMKWISTNSAGNS